MVKKGPNFIDTAFKTARRKTRRSSCIIFIFMCIVAAAALLSKWAIIQQIHNEIVHKYYTNQSLYYTQNSICGVINLQQFNVLTFPIACFLIILFIIRTKRTSLARNKCYGYGAPPMPVDFLSHIDRKFAAVVFAICADELLSIMEEALGFGNTKIVAEGVILRYLLRILQVIIMGFRYYPLLAAVYLDSIFSLLGGMVYAWLDYAVTIVNLGMCKADFYPTYEEFLSNSSSSIVEKFEYYGTGPNLIAIQLCIDIPRFLCIAYVCVKLTALLIIKIYYRMKKKISLEKKILRELTREQRTFFYIANPASIEMLYVRNLLRPPNERPRSQSLLARILPKKIYDWRDDFHFSARIVCVYASLFLLLYFITIQACVRIIPRLASWEKSIQQAADIISLIFFPMDSETDTSDTDPNGNTSNFPIPSLIRPFLLAVFLTLGIIVSQLLVFLVNMRRNLFQSYRGDDVEIPRRCIIKLFRGNDHAEVPGNQISRYISLSTGNVHFAGYFIGYLIWGFIIIAVFAVIICVALEAFVTYGSVRVVEKFLKWIIPTVLFILFKQYINKVLAKYVFLQHHGQVLSLNNRRLLMIYIYFNFFLDAFLGFVSSIMRLVKSVIGGIIYMCRLDYSTLGRKLETMDGGFSAYCGFVHTECTHRHPVMLVFVAHLYTQMKVRQLALETTNFADIKVVRLQSRFTRKWKLAVFLIRNPMIVFFRKAFLRQLHVDEIDALNHPNEKNLQKRLSIYARRMSATQLSVNSIDLSNSIQKGRF